MKTILILRHAKSSWKHPELSDFQRPLNKRGKRDAPRMGRLLREEGIVPDLILSSTAERALKTADLAADACGIEEAVIAVDAFYHAGPGTYYRVISQTSDVYSKVMVVGHNPGAEDFFEELVGFWERLPTAALAQVELPINHWKELVRDVQGTLQNLWLPRNLRP